MIKTNFNTLAEFEEILRNELGMTNYWVEYNEYDQPIYLKVETSTHKVRKVKARTCNDQGHLKFQFCIFENGHKRMIHFQVHRVVFLLENPLANISGLVVDHLNNCPTDNRICNLQAISQRLNSNKDKVIVPRPTKHSVEYCTAKLSEYENEYQKQLDIDNNIKTNPEAHRLEKKVSYWKQRLAYATLNNQYEFKVKELF